jgi:chromosome partitioning protein
MDLRAIPNSIRLCRLREKTPHVLLTQVEPQGTLHDEARTQLIKMGAEVLPGALGRRAAYHHSIIDGRGVVEYEPSGKGAQEVRGLFSEVSKLVGKPSSRQVSRNVPMKRKVASR